MCSAGCVKFWQLGPSSQDGYQIASSTAHPFALFNSISNVELSRQDEEYRLLLSNLCKYTFYFFWIFLLYDCRNILNIYKERDHTRLISFTLENREWKSITSGYGYANFLYVAFFFGCFGEELKVDKGIVSYLKKHINCKSFLWKYRLLTSKMQKTCKKML